MIKVYIQREFYSESIGILFTEERDGKRYNAKPVEFVFEEHKEFGEEIKPTIRVSSDIAPDFLKAIAEALDKQGIKTENDFKIQGLLTATKEHLRDMRRLVFKGKN